MSAANSTDAAHRRSTSAPYLLHRLVGGDVVAGRLVHRAAVGVDDPAGRDDCLVGRRALDRNAVTRMLRNQPRILVAAFEIRVGRPRHAVALPSTAQVRHARFEPDVDDVELFFERRAAAVRARETLGQKDATSIGPPRVGAVLRGSARRRCCATSASRIELPQSHAASAGIGVPQVRWREMHHSGWFSIICAHALSPHAGVHATCGIFSTMLLRSRLTSIAMNHCAVARKITGFLQRQQCGYECWYSVALAERAARAQVVDDPRVGVEDLQPGVRARLGREAPAARRPDERRQPEAHAGLEVVGAVARRCVNRAGAGLELDVVGARRPPNRGRGTDGARRRRRARSRARRRSVRRQGRRRSAKTPSRQRVGDDEQFVAATVDAVRTRRGAARSRRWPAASTASSSRSGTRGAPRRGRRSSRAARISRRCASVAVKRT